MNTTQRGLGRWLWPLGACAALVGCAPRVATPSGFVSFDEPGGYDYRASTADGLVISAKKLDDESDGDVEFWARAIENEMRFRGGYALIESRAVTTRSGLLGKQLRFGHDEGSEPHLYYVTVLVGSESSWIFFEEPTLYILEAGGTKALVEKHASQIEWAIKQFDAAAL